MRLISIHLENIRSYHDAAVEFPIGSVLLAGDIGAGKSTILLAVEFALFGIRQPELPGSALLRHGASEGSVELIFEVDSHKVVIRRVLRRVKDRIGQAPGSVTIDGLQMDLMPKEIRAKVFELLRYPESLVSRNQDLIYRFTVYTPQECMKQILFEDPEIRLDTLRKVFAIDRYKRARENLTVFLRVLRERRASHEGQVMDLRQKEDQRSLYENEKAKLLTLIDVAKNEFVNASAQTQSQKAALETIEKDISFYREQQRTFERLDSQLRAAIEKRGWAKKESGDLERYIAKIEAELSQTVPQVEPEMLRKKEQEKESLEGERRRLLEKRAAISGKISHIEEDAVKIQKLENCPLCLQAVPHEHKEGIFQKRMKSVADLKNECAILSTQVAELGRNIEEQTRLIREMIENMSRLRERQIKEAHLREKKQDLEQKNKIINECKQNVSQINSAKLPLEQSAEKSRILEQKYQAEKGVLENHLKVERALEIKYATLMKDADALDRQISLLSKEIEMKQTVKARLVFMTEQMDFLLGTCIPLITSMEKHVFTNVYREFNALFQNWFSMLIDDPALSVRLDDRFSVVVQQNGYESGVEYLSGGEKTAVALAYRLSLNRVVNDVMSSISTKDILILDEPTEGFSEDQLDRVRDVIEQLGMKQTLIVSHESKIESFVDKVIRVRKRDGESTCS